MIIAIYGRQGVIANSKALAELIGALSRFDTEIVIYKGLVADFSSDIPSLSDLNTFDNSHDLPKDADFLISLGGDGTILDTVSIVRESAIPILGINTGRLGFLASISQDEITSAVGALQNQNFSIDRRSLVSVESNQPLFDDFNAGLNEFTIQRSTTSSMITIHAYLNGELLNSYWADGLIVSTATGSTGYSLSCGGPILYPNSENFIITPVSPHNLNVRPMVVSDKSVLSFEVEGRENKFLATIDSRAQVIDSSFEIAVRKAGFQFNLIRFDDRGFLRAIRDKLLWGSDQRN